MKSTKKVVCKLTDKENKKMMKIEEKKYALRELFISLYSCMPEEEIIPTYKSIVKDLIETKDRFSDYWDYLAMKYNWNSLGHVDLIIDFSSNEVYIR